MTLNGRSALGSNDHPIKTNTSYEYVDVPANITKTSSTERIGPHCKHHQMQLRESVSPLNILLRNMETCQSL